jgi:hypothetical protein
LTPVQTALWSIESVRKYGSSISPGAYVQVQQAAATDTDTVILLCTATQGRLVHALRYGTRTWASY